MCRSRFQRCAGFGSPYVLPLMVVVILVLIVNAFLLGFGAANRKGLDGWSSSAVGLGAAIFVFAGFGGMGCWIVRRVGKGEKQPGDDKRATSPGDEAP